MSQEDLELVMRALGAATKRPKPDFETINALFHSDHVWVPIPAMKLGEAERKGARGYQAWLEDEQSVMPSEANLEGAVDVAAGTILAVMTIRFRGASSGADVEERVWFVVTVADGKIRRTASYNDPREAFEAVRASLA